METGEQKPSFGFCDFYPRRWLLFDDIQQLFYFINKINTQTNYLLLVIFSYF